MKTSLCLATLAMAIAILGILSLTYAQGVDVRRRGGPYVPHIFEPKGGARSTIKNLIDHGGPVLPTSHVYSIYWGAVPSDISDALDSFFSGFGGGSYANILTHYMRGLPPAPPARSGHPGFFIWNDGPENSSPSICDI